jgi:ferritin-like metal-binding protein YciE
MGSEEHGFSVNDAMKDIPLHKFFLSQLKDIYHAEKQLAEALPDMVSASDSGELSAAVSHHLGETKTQINRLEKIFQMLDEKPEEKPCKAMAGILKEGKEILADTKDLPAVKDAAIIVAAQKAEHYEIASYGSLLEFSELMGHHEVSRLLKETLNEEEQVNKTLTDLAENGINEKALKED